MRIPKSGTKSLIYPELSYKIVGILFDVYNRFGYAYPEKYLQKAIEEALKTNKVPFKKEEKVDLYFDGKKIGRHFVDFIIDDKIVLEIKKGFRISVADTKQVLMYLRSFNLRLGILAYFGSDKLIYKRIVNSKARVFNDEAGVRNSHDLL